MPLRRSQKIVLAAFVLGSGLLGLSVFRGSSGSACRLVPYNQSATTTAPVPAQLPEWSLKGIDGQTHDLQALAGDLTIIAFWATWCPNCHRELATLRELHEELSPAGLSIIGISLDGAKREDQVVRYAAEAELPFPVVYTDRSDHAEMSAIRAVPTLLIYDAEGQLVGHFEGQTDKADLLELAQSHLAPGSVAVLSRR
jgi:peroxiredoxin|tara:strand:- start:326 stop:919 length:594 start_codon:yes stop_codon:yes gene_type:complete